MKQVLNEESKNALIIYRLNRSKETLPEADMLIKNGYFNAAVSRLYYACYYAVTALLLKNDIFAQTHQGVKQMFSLHFIVTGKICNKYSQFYAQIFNDRMSGDYDDFLLYDFEKVSALRSLVDEFVQIIESELKK
jgi:uncharacterized protein (UPF0332 family)